MNTSTSTPERVSTPATRFVLAAAQYPVSAPRDWHEVEQQLSQWCAEAAAHEAKLLLFPEYASMSLAALFAAEVQADLHAQIHAMQALRERYVDLHRALARQHHAYIVAGSFPWQLTDGSFRNRAWLCAPDGRADFQDKRVMTRFEREQWHIAGGDALKVFDTALGCLAIDICYDIEFPLLARAQAEAGAKLILSPSCTDTLGGYHRVRVGAQARALENQCYTVQAPLVGEAPWSPAIDINVGAAGVFGPPDRAFPDDGVVALGTLNSAQWIYAEIDTARVHAVRTQGQVFNHRHWSDQFDGGIATALPMIERVVL